MNSAMYAEVPRSAGTGTVVEANVILLLVVGARHLIAFAAYRVTVRRGCADSSY
jgi:hypothetical protein